MDTKQSISVFIVDDSKVARDLLVHIIEQDPQLRVVGSANDGEQALRWLKFQAVDVVTMDIHMPGINGFEVTKKIMEAAPIPVVIVSACYTPTDQALIFRAIEKGALAILEKPNVGSADFAKKAEEIRATIKMVAGIKLIKRKTGWMESKKQDVHELSAVRDIQAIAIGASLGGPQVFADILSKLSPELQVPIFIVQHIADGFTESFVRWLQGMTKLKMYVAEEGMKAARGCVYVAPDRCHMEVTKDHVIRLDKTATHDGPRPSVARLFKSMATAYGPHAIGVMLTGMGKDGAEEMLLMKNSGAYTIAQDEESCVVYGMPGAAVSRGAVRQVLSPDEIIRILNSLVK